MELGYALQCSGVGSCRGCFVLFEFTEGDSHVSCCNQTRFETYLHGISFPSRAEQPIGRAVVPAPNGFGHKVTR